MARRFVLAAQEVVVHGVDALGALPEMLARIEARRVLLITGRSVQASDLPARVRSEVRALSVGVFGGACAHTPAAAVRAGAEVVRSYAPDALIALGGSSTTDCAKGAALLAAEGEPLEAHRVRFEYPDRLTIPRLRAPKLPIVAIPTTLSGSEFGPNIGITMDGGQKETFIDPAVTPRAVILDPALTLSTPMHLWLSTGVKVVDHAVERLYSRFAHPLSSPLCRDALRLAVEGLRMCASNPGALEPRVNLQIASWFSVFGHVNTSTGLNHALGHQLGGRHRVPHGVAAGITLPHVLRFNQTAASSALANAARALDVGLWTVDDAQAVGWLIEVVDRLVADLGLPTRLRDVGIPRGGLPAVAEAALRDRSAMANPRPIRDVGEVLRVLEAAW